MVNCCVIGCKSRSERNEPNISFHHFPNEPRITDKWIKCTGRIEWHPSRHSRICSRHFETNCFLQKNYKTCLNPSSVPTLFIQNIQTTVADHFKCNKIIANVYHYLQKEYVSLKSQFGGLCDVSVLSNTLARTAAATGVSQDEVEIALREAELHSDQTREEDKTDSLRPLKRKATNKSVPSKPIDEEQLPFPAPIQLRVHGVMETECKIEPVDKPLTMDDPLEAESSSHCGTAEEVEIKTEPVDYESPQNIKDDPLAPEWSPTALEQPSDPPDFIEVKSEHVDHDHADLFWDPSSMYDKKRPDIKPKQPLQ